MERKRICDMEPIDFEKACLEILKGYAEEEQLKDFEITHNKLIKSSDGKYQIDIFAKFTAMKSQFKVLCECKRYKYSISREKVAVLHQKIISLGAQKGILISTSDFQSGAIEYAKAHGIALIKADDYYFEHLSHSNDKMQCDDDPFLYAEKHMPSYIAYDCTCDTDEPKKVYPTRKIIKQLIIEQNTELRNKLGIDVKLDFPDV